MSSKLDEILEDVDYQNPRKEDIKSLFLELVTDEVQPCEPECTTVRHSYHQGQWDMMQRLEKKINEL